MSPTAAARRRDFTVNSIALDPLTGEVLSRYPEAIKEAWQQVMRIALDNEEYVALRDDDEHPGIEHYMDLALLKDLCRAYDSGASLVKLEEYEPAQRIAMVIRETRAKVANQGGFT